MNKRIAPWAVWYVTVANLCLLSFATGLRADDGFTEIPLAQVPKTVLDVVKKKFPDAKLQSASRGVDEGKPFYDVFIVVKAHNVWVTCTPQGAILEIDRELSPGEIPQPVLAALNKKYPKAAIRGVNELTENNVVNYDIALSFGPKKLVVLFKANGKVVDELDEEAEPATGTK